LFFFTKKTIFFELHANGRDAAFCSSFVYIPLLPGFRFELEPSPIRSQKIMLEIVFLLFFFEEAYNSKNYCLFLLFFWTQMVTMQHPVPFFLK
jgi:hypothetical protein